MKAAELLACATCAMCSKPIGSSGLPLFWRVRIERFGVDLRAVQRTDALATMIGSAAIAQAMGPNEDLAKPMMDPVSVTICEPCAMKETIVAGLAELGGKAEGAAAPIDPYLQTR